MYDRRSPEQLDSQGASAKPVYSIGAVSRMTGVAVATIRNWEERYEGVVPGRSAGGQRLYSRNEVDRLQLIRGLIDAGSGAAEAHRIAAIGADDPQRPGRDGTPRRHLVILLAERDPYAAELAEYFLRTEGYEVTLVFDVSEARRRVDEAPPDLIVIEWLVGGGMGGPLCREVRAKTSRPILVISSLAVGEAAIEAGADAFLLKPLDPLLFVSSVKDLLGESAYLRGPERRP